MLHKLAKSHTSDTRTHEVNEKGYVIHACTSSGCVFILDVQTLHVSWNDCNHSGLHFTLSYHQTMISPVDNTGPRPLGNPAAAELCYITY